MKIRHLRLSLIYDIHVYLDSILPHHSVVHPHGRGDGAVIRELHQGEPLVGAVLGAPAEVLNLPGPRGKGVNDILGAGVGPDLHHHDLQRINNKYTQSY